MGKWLIFKRLLDMPKLVVISFILARPVTFVSVVEGIIRMKKIYKRIIFESDREYVKDLILKLYFSITNYGANIC
jgi:formate hydrogenlyase subunit 3/multisubunit Na+/H+ antiporter MnhD subunit